MCPLHGDVRPFGNTGSRLGAQPPGFAALCRWRAICSGSPQAMQRSPHSPARAFVVHDYLALSYLTVLSILVAASPGAAQARVLLRLGLCAAVVLGGALVHRFATELPLAVRRNT